MSKREQRKVQMLSRLLPYVTGRKQMTALFTVALLLVMTHTKIDIPHIHTEPAPVTMISVIVESSTSGTTGPTGMTITQLS